MGIQAGMGGRGAGLGLRGIERSTTRVIKLFGAHQGLHLDNRLTDIDTLSALSYILSCRRQPIKMNLKFAEGSLRRRSPLFVAALRGLLAFGGRMGRKVGHTLKDGQLVAGVGCVMFVLSKTVAVTPTCSGETYYVDVMILRN